jgi:hypothetical protein
MLAAKRSSKAGQTGNVASPCKAEAAGNSRQLMAMHHAAH